MNKARRAVRRGRHSADPPDPLVRGGRRPAARAGSGEERREDQPCLSRRTPSAARRARVSAVCGIRRIARRGEGAPPAAVRTFCLARRARGRGGRIRTDDLVLPKHVRYQTTPHPARPMIGPKGTSSILAGRGVETCGARALAGGLAAGVAAGGPAVQPLDAVPRVVFDGDSRRVDLAARSISRSRMSAPRDVARPPDRRTERGTESPRRASEPVTPGGHWQADRSPGVAMPGGGLRR